MLLPDGATPRERRAEGEEDTMENGRLEAIFTDIVEGLRQVIREHAVTEAEYRTAIAWLTEAGTQPNEIPLMADILFATTVDDVNVAVEKGTESNVEGPFYVPGAPLLSAPHVLPMRPDEPGEPLSFSGTVRSIDGTALAGTMLDLWQVSADGGYSNFHPHVPEFNLRGRLVTDEQGRFEVQTRVPVPYEVPKNGAAGVLLEALGRAAYRPAHLHLKVTHEGHRPLTTQIYLAGDPWLDRDVVGATKASLVAQVERDGAAGGACLVYDITLDPAGTPALV
jgi:catechol 1,2-dioxygenase